MHHHPSTPPCVKNHISINPSHHQQYHTRLILNYQLNITITITTNKNINHLSSHHPSHQSPLMIPLMVPLSIQKAQLQPIKPLSKSQDCLPNPHQALKFTLQSSRPSPWITPMVALMNEIKAN